MKPIPKLRFTKAEEREYRVRLARLEKMGIQIGCAEVTTREPDRLTLQQIDYELAKVCELPSGAVAVVVPAGLKVLRSGILITDCEMTVPWDHSSLDLSDPAEAPFYEDLIGGLYHLSPNILNRWLTNHVPLRPRQEDGVIIANGWCRVPPEWRAETPVTVELFLTDERCNELRFEFKALLDRSVKRKYERRQQYPRGDSRLTKRPRIFQREDGQPEGQSSDLLEEAIEQLQGSAEFDATCDAGSSETKPENQ